MRYGYEEKGGALWHEPNLGHLRSAWCFCIPSLSRILTFLSGIVAIVLLHRLSGNENTERASFPFPAVEDLSIHFGHTSSQLPMFLTTPKEKNDIKGAALSMTSSTAPPGVILILLQDAGASDLAPEGNAAIPMNQTPPEYLTGFRVSSPDTLPSQIGWLTGRPADDFDVFQSPVPGHNPQASKLTGADTLLYHLKSENVRVGHFGTWSLPVSLKNVTHAHLISSDPIQTVQAAQSFVQECIRAGKQFYAQVWLPQVDVAFETAPWAQELLNSVPGVKDNSPLCRDIRRRSNHPHRYISCPRMIHEASKMKERELVAGLLQAVFDAPTRIPYFAAVSSTNGPEVAEVYGHAAGMTTFRGRKRSLYDGGIRVPFLYWSNIRGQALPNLNRDELVGAVDWAPTCTALLGTKQFQRGVGADQRAFLLGNYPQAARPQPLVWEWKFPVIGHCLEESPAYAIMQDYRYKLLVEPNEFGDIQSPLRVELYRVHDELTKSGHYERSNMAILPAHAERIQTLMDALQKWHKKEYSDSSPRSYTHAGCAERLQRPFVAREKANADKILKKVATQKPVRGIIVMLADDLGYGDVAAFDPSNGATKDWLSVDGNVFEPHTPVLDQLAREGLVLSDFYANAAVCSPTRASILTGRYPFNKHVAMHWQAATSAEQGLYFGNVPYLGAAMQNFSRNLHYMNTAFRDAGYVTGHFGKWHLGNLPETEPHSSPADPMYGIDEMKMYSTTHKSLPRENRYNHNDLYFSSHIQHDIVSRAISFLQDRVEKSQKFLLQLWFQNTHAPLNLAADGRQAHSLGLGFQKLPFPGRDMANECPNESFPNKLADPHLPLQIYRALVRDHDQQIGRLLQWIDKQGLRDDVLIVYLSDNGPENSGMYFASQGSAGPFRGGKRSLYEGGVRVPMIMRGPGIAPNSVLSTPTSTVDLFPTFVDFAHIVLNETVRSELDGMNVFHAPMNRSLFFEFRGWAHGSDCLSHSPRFSIRRNQYKLLVEPHDGRQAVPQKLEPIELYDLSADPAELVNIIDFHRDVVTSMVQSLMAYLHSGKYDRAYMPSLNLRLKRRQQLLQCRQLMTNSSFLVGQPYDRVISGKTNRKDLYRFPFIYA